jgi:hypothetical protein
MGWQGCDNKIAYEMKSMGLDVSNPSLTIRSWHVHKNWKRPHISEGKSYHRDYHFWQEAVSVPISKLNRV